MVFKAFQSIRGKTFVRSLGFGSIVSETSSQSFGWRGKEVEVVLQAFTAQVRKLRVRTFIFARCDRVLGVVEGERQMFGVVMWDGSRGRNFFSGVEVWSAWRTFVYL